MAFFVIFIICYIKIIYSLFYLIFKGMYLYVLAWQIIYLFDICKFGIWIKQNWFKEIVFNN